MRELDYESGDEAPTNRKPRGSKKKAPASKSGGGGGAKRRTAPRPANPLGGQGSRRAGSAGTTRQA
jgi:hypothetical protein